MNNTTTATSGRNIIVRKLVHATFFAAITVAALNTAGVTENGHPQMTNGAYGHTNIVVSSLPTAT